MDTQKQKARIRRWYVPVIQSRLEPRKKNGMPQFLSTGVIAMHVEDDKYVDVDDLPEDFYTSDAYGDRMVDYLEETVSTTVSSRCMSGTGNPDEVSAARKLLTGPSHGAFIIAWIATAGVGFLFGMGFLLL